MPPFHLNSKHLLINCMTKDHVASILSFGRKTNVPPVVNLQGAVAGVWSCWCSAVMDVHGCRMKTFGFLTTAALNSLAKQLIELAFVIAFLIHL